MQQHTTMVLRRKVHNLLRLGRRQVISVAHSPRQHPHTLTRQTRTRRLTNHVLVTRVVRRPATVIMRKVPMTLRRHICAYLRHVRINMVVRLVSQRRLKQVKFRPRLTTLVATRFNHHHIIVLRRHLRNHLTRRATTFKANNLRTIRHLLRIRILMPHIGMVRFKRPLRTYTMHICTLSRNNTAILLLSFINTSTSLRQNNRAFRVPFPQTSDNFIRVVSVRRRANKEKTRGTRVTSVHITRTLRQGTDS